MKSLIQFCFAIAICSILFTSCANDPCGNDKDAFIKMFNNLVDDIEAIDYDTKHSKWEAYDKEFKRLVDECYEIHEDDFTRREEKKFGKQVAGYYLKTLAGQVDFEEYAAGIGKMMNENIGGISEELSDVFDSIDININIDDQEIEELFEELGGDIEKMGKKWGKKLEKILEKK